jgi:transcriptional regulator with XRE-family HTH domain
MLKCVFMMPDSINDVAVFLQLVGRRVAAAREYRGLTQGELADRSELPVGTLAGLERGEYGVEVDELHRVADVLRVALTELLPPEAEVRGVSPAPPDGGPQTQQGPAGGGPAGP